MMDQDEAIWLAELLLEAISYLEDSPGLTVEVEGELNQWVQVVFEADEADGSLKGFNLNFPYRGQAGDPVTTLTKAGLSIPPDTQSKEWEDDGFATIWIRPDVPIVALALFIGDILDRIIKTAPGASLAVQIEYGF